MEFYLRLETKREGESLGERFILINNEKRTQPTQLCVCVCELRKEVQGEGEGEGESEGE